MMEEERKIKQAKKKAEAERIKREIMEEERKREMERHKNNFGQQKVDYVHVSHSRNTAAQYSREEAERAMDLAYKRQMEMAKEAQMPQQQTKEELEAIKKRERE